MNFFYAPIRRKKFLTFFIFIIFMDFWFYFHTLLIDVLMIFNFIQKYMQKCEQKMKNWLGNILTLKSSNTSPGKKHVTSRWYLIMSQKRTEHLKVKNYWFSYRAGEGGCAIPHNPSPKSDSVFQIRIRIPSLLTQVIVGWNRKKCVLVKWFWYCWFITWINENITNCSRLFKQVLVYQMMLSQNNFPLGRVRLSTKFW